MNVLCKFYNFIFLIDDIKPTWISFPVNPSKEENKVRKNNELMHQLNTPKFSNKLTYASTKNTPKFLIN